MKKTLLAVMATVSLCSYAQIVPEGFETPWTGTPAAPPNWIVINEFGSQQTWKQTLANSVTQPAYTGQYAAYLENETVAAGEAIPSDWLITPAFAKPQLLQLNFYSRLTLSGDQGSTYKVYVMPASLAPTVANFTSNPSFLVASYNEFALNPLQTDWTLKQINVPANETLWPAGTQLRVALVMTGNGGDRWLVDDFSVKNLCPAPTDVVISSQGLNEITYIWTGTDAASYDYLLTTQNTPPTGSSIPTGNVSSATATVAGLVPGTTYKFYVRSHCPDGGISDWAGLDPDETLLDDNVFTGIVAYDADGDGVCNENAGGIPYVEVQVSINDAPPFSVFTNQEGKYKLYNIADGTNSLSLHVISPELFAVSEPLIQEVIFSEVINEAAVVHCLAQPETGSDLSVVMIPLGTARPGFPATYHIIAHNAGSTVQDNVSLTISFDDARIDYVSSGYSNTVAAEGSLTINLGTMQPFSVNNGAIEFNVLIPPVNMGGEVLHFETTLSDVPNDTSPENNEAVLNQVIVNSYDPNDITVHEGAEIYEEQTDDYLTYTIRFQNTGTAEAINIKLENTLDELLDWETFKPLVSSHNYIVKRTDDFLEFEYDKIHLPDSTSNEPASHGYITYKIKPKAQFGLNDEVSNTAEIYFDFNPAIITNTATTKVVALAGLKDNATAIARLYPNPVKDQLMVDVVSGGLQSVTIHDINGRLCLSANAGVVDTNALTSGVYFVKITTDAGSANYKIIKQ